MRPSERSGVNGIRVNGPSGLRAGARVHSEKGHPLEVQTDPGELVVTRIVARSLFHSGDEVSRPPCWWGGGEEGRGEGGGVAEAAVAQRRRARQVS